jgi:hypothetical protein
MSSSTESAAKDAQAAHSCLADFTDGLVPGRDGLDVKLTKAAPAQHDQGGGAPAQQGSKAANRRWERELFDLCATCHLAPTHELGVAPPPPPNSSGSSSHSLQLCSRAIINVGS